MRKKIIAAAAALLIGAGSAGAEPMGIIEAIDLTLSQNLTLRSVREEAAKAYARRVGADGLWTPSITVNAYIDKQREMQTSDGSNRDSNTVARANLTQTIYSGGRNSALRRQAQTSTEIADLKLIDAENRAIGTLFALFYDTLLQRERIAAERSAVATSEAHLRELERMNEVGLSNRLEVIRASQGLATNRANLIAAEGKYGTAVIALMNFMTIPPEEQRELKGMMKAIKVAGDRASSLEAARKNRADLKAAEAQTRYQKDQVEVARSAGRPNISLGASAGYLDPYNRTDRGSDTWRAELSITVPILDRSSTRSAVLDAQATLRQTELALSISELDIVSGVEAAWTELDAANERLTSTERALELAQESLRLSEVGFQEGVTPQLDLLTAQTAFTEAQLAHLSALYDQMLAVVALKVTEGNIIQWTSEVTF